MDNILPAGSSPHTKDTPEDDLLHNNWLDFPSLQNPMAPEVTPESTPEVILEDALPGILNFQTTPLFIRPLPSRYPLFGYQPLDYRQ